MPSSWTLHYRDLNQPLTHTCGAAVAFFRFSCWLNCSRFFQVFILAQSTRPYITHNASHFLYQSHRSHYVIAWVCWSHDFHCILVQEWCNIFHKLLLNTSNACGGCRSFQNHPTGVRWCRKAVDRTGRSSCTSFVTTLFAIYKECPPHSIPSSRRNDGLVAVRCALLYCHRRVVIRHLPLHVHKLIIFKLGKFGARFFFFFLAWHHWSCHFVIIFRLVKFRAIFFL